MLYMLGQVIIDVGGDLTPTFLIKVGVSRSLNARMAQYRTDNPSALLISTTSGVNAQETACHHFLSRNGKCYWGEWYKVDKDFFLRCVREGFDFFPKQNKKQNVYKHISELKRTEICNHYQKVS